jgi:hypothetical protein
VTAVSDVAVSDIIRNVEELAEKFPNKEAKCVYFHGNGRPSCIVGAALYKAGIKRKDLFHDGVYNGDMNEGYGVAPELFTNLGITIDVDPDEIERLGMVQSAQDNGKTWAEAVKRLDPEFKDDDY